MHKIIILVRSLKLQQQEFISIQNYLILYQFALHLIVFEDQYNFLLQIQSKESSYPKRDISCTRFYLLIPFFVIF